MGRRAWAEYPLFPSSSFYLPHSGDRFGISLVFYPSGESDLGQRALQEDTIVYQAKDILRAGFEPPGLLL